MKNIDLFKSNCIQYHSKTRGTISQNNTFFRIYNFHKKRTYGSDTYHKISITDPDYYGVPEGTLLDKAVLIMSLPDAPFPVTQSDNEDEYRYYKFIAKIFKL